MNQESFHYDLTKPLLDAGEFYDIEGRAERIQVLQVGRRQLAEVVSIKTGRDLGSESDQTFEEDS